MPRAALCRDRPERHLPRHPGTASARASLCRQCPDGYRWSASLRERPARVDRERPAGGLSDVGIPGRHRPEGRRRATGRQPADGPPIAARHGRRHRPGLLWCLFGLVLGEALLSAGGWAITARPDCRGNSRLAWARCCRRLRAPPLAWCFLAGARCCHAVWSQDFLGFLPDRARASAWKGRSTYPSRCRAKARHWRLEYTRVPAGRNAALEPWLVGGHRLASASSWSWHLSPRGPHRQPRPIGCCSPGLRAFSWCVLLLLVLLPQTATLVRAAGLARRRHHPRRLEKHERRRPVSRPARSRRPPTN